MARMNMQLGTLNIFFNNSNSATAFLGSILSKSSTYIKTFLKGFVSLSDISKTRSFSWFRNALIEFCFSLSNSSATSLAFVPRVAAAPILSAPLKTVTALCFIISVLFF